VKLRISGVNKYCGERGESQFPQPDRISTFPLHESFGACRRQSAACLFAKPNYATRLMQNSFRQFTAAGNSGRHQKLRNALT